MKRLLLLFILQISFLSGYCQNCNSIPKHFTSYEQAKQQVKKADFKFSDQVNTSKSSWITGAEYYSCNGSTGYLIIYTDRGHDYIFDKVPMTIWIEFKNATSLGTYYNTYIRNRYKLNLQ